MDLLIIWLGSVAASIGFNLSLAFSVFKDVADQGYKIDMKRLEELGEQLNPKARKMNTLSLFIPVINIIFQFDKLAKYIAIRPFVSDQLRVMDCITPFTKEEEESYNLKPTGLNAIIVTIKSDVSKNKEDMAVSFTDENERSERWFKSINGKSDRLQEIHDEKQMLQETRDMLIGSTHQTSNKEENSQNMGGRQLKRIPKNLRN
jgi:hypothetical protein